MALHIIDEALKTRIERIRLIAMDVDGVLTEGRLFYTRGRGEVGCFHIKDGMGFTLARQVDLKIAIISGRISEAVARRAADLYCLDVYQGVIKKLVPFFQLLQKYGLTKEQACYIGDDVNDLPVLKEAGLAVSVADAVEEVKRVAHYVTTSPGGRGAVREVIDNILYIQGLYEEAIKVFE